MLSKPTIEELQKIILEEYKVSLNFAEVSEIGDKLVGYFSLLAKINHKTKNYEQH